MKFDNPSALRCFTGFADNGCVIVAVRPKRLYSPAFRFLKQVVNISFGKSGTAGESEGLYTVAYIAEFRFCDSIDYKYEFISGHTARDH